MSSSESCKETCDWYRHTWDYGCYDHKLCSHHRRCKGKVRDCRYLNGETWVCPSVRKFKILKLSKLKNSKSKIFLINLHMFECRIPRIFK